ncbi:MAG TPA: hypothetical protein EYF98_04935 [Planctomycetes bacterium]|nr:hypothetical protein [Planctomycetota bacterium]
MLGKMITFGLGVFTGVYIAPMVRRFQARLSDEQNTLIVELPGETMMEIPKPEAGTQFDAAVEAFLHASADMAGDLVA